MLGGPISSGTEDVKSGGDAFSLKELNGDIDGEIGKDGGASRFISIESLSWAGPA